MTIGRYMLVLIAMLAMFGLGAFAHSRDASHAVPCTTPTTSPGRGNAK